MGFLKELRVANDVRQIQAGVIAHHRLDSVRLNPLPTKNAIICIIHVRNELLRLPDCLRHHRELGVDRFAVIDNNSDDGTRDYLADQPDVDIFLTLDSFSEARGGIYWQERLAARYGYDRWYLTVDADEQLVYSGMRRHNLHRLAEYLRSWNAKAFLAPMIDMYANVLLGEYTYAPGQRMLDVCRFFDGTSYKVQKRDTRIIDVTGGPRVRLLSNSSGAFGNYINKYPFFYWDKTVRRRNIHHFEAHKHKTPPSGALLHFKFLPDLPMRIDRALEEKQYWNNSVQYRHYSKNMEQLNNLFYDDSLEYFTPESLSDRGLMNRIYWSARRPTKSLITAFLQRRPLLRSFETLEG